MQRPLLRTPYCEIEEIVDERTDVNAAEPAPTHLASVEADASDSVSKPSTGLSGARQPLATALSDDDDDEFHDVLEPGHPLEAANDTCNADDVESFHDVEDPTLNSSTPTPEALNTLDKSPLPPNLALPASHSTSPAFTTPLESVSESAPPESAAPSGYGKLPSPEPDRRVRPPQSGSRPYPPHSEGPSMEAHTVAGVVVQDGEGEGDEPVYQDGREDVPLGSLPAAGAPEPRKYSAEEMQASVEAAEVLKKEGNSLYAAGDMEGAVEKYGEALEAALEGVPQRAVYFANRAACQLKMKEWGSAASDCTRALDIDPGYLKALARRCAAYQEMDDLDRALTDAQKVLELDPEDAAMRKVVKKLEPIVEERREKMKEEMMGKLKDLGNTVLGKFGLSLDNFKAEKDPTTGSYSIQFNQS